MWRASVLLFMNCVIIRRSSLALPHHTFPGVHNPFGDPELYPEYYGPEATAAPPWRPNYVPTFSVSYQPDSDNEDNGANYPANGGRLDLENNQQGNTPRKEHSPTAPREGGASSSDDGRTSVVYPNHNVTVPRLYQIYWKLRQEGKTLKEHYENAPNVPDMYGTGQDLHRGRRRKPTVEDLAAVVAAAERKFGSPQANDGMNSYAPINPRESFPPHNRGTRSPYRLGDYYIDRPLFPVQGFKLDTMHLMDENVDGYWYLREQEQRRLEEEQEIRRRFNRLHHHRNFWEPKFYAQAHVIGARAGDAWAVEPSLGSSVSEDFPEHPAPAGVPISAAGDDAVKAMDDIVIDQEAIAATHLQQQNRWPSACVGCSQPAPETARPPMTADDVQPPATRRQIPDCRSTTTTQPAPPTTTQASSTTFNPAFADYYEDDSADEQLTEKPLETAKPVQKSRKTFSGVQVNPEFDDYYVDEDEADEGPASPITGLPLSAADGRDSLLSQRVGGVGSESATEGDGGQLDSGIALRTPIVNGPAQSVKRRQPNQASRGPPSSASVGGLFTDIDDHKQVGAAARSSSAECRDCLRADLERKKNGTGNFESEIKRIAAERKQDEEADKQQYAFRGNSYPTARNPNQSGKPAAQTTSSRSFTVTNGRPSSSSSDSRNSPVGPAVKKLIVSPPGDGSEKASHGRRTVDVGGLQPEFDRDQSICRRLADADREESVPDGGDELAFATNFRGTEPVEATTVGPFQGIQPQPPAIVLEYPSARPFEPFRHGPPETEPTTAQPVFQSESTTEGQKSVSFFERFITGAKTLSSQLQSTAQDVYQRVTTNLKGVVGGGSSRSQLGTNQVPASSYTPQEQPFVEAPRRPQDPSAVTIRRRRQTQGAPEYIDVRDVTPPSYLSADERKTWNEVIDLAKQYATRFSSIVVDPQDEVDNRKSVIIDTVESSREDFLGKIGSAWNLNDLKVVESIDDLGEALDG